jgi:hypothetical protein
MLAGSPWRRQADLGFAMQAQQLEFAEAGNVRQERGFARSEANLQRGYGALGRQELALGRGVQGLERATRGRAIEVEYNRFRYGADTPASFSRDAYFAQQRALAEAARTGAPIPDEVRQNAPGFEARQFYGGVEHQRRMLVYGQTPWLAGRAYEEQQAELTRQEQLFQEQAAAEIPGRSLQAEERDAQLRDRAAEIEDHRAALADSRADLDASREALNDQRQALAEERTRLVSQQEMLTLQIETYQKDLEANWESLTFQQDLLAQQGGIAAIGRRPSEEAVAAFAAEYQANPAAIAERLALLSPAAETRVREAFGMGDASAAGNVLVGLTTQQRAENERALAEGRAPVNVLTQAGVIPTPSGMEASWNRLTESAFGRWLRSAVPGMRTQVAGGNAANQTGADDLASYLAAFGGGVMGGAMGPGMMLGANAAGIGAGALGTALQLAQVAGIFALLGKGGAAAAPGVLAATGGGGAAGAGAGAAGVTAAGGAGGAGLMATLLPILGMGALVAGGGVAQMGINQALGVTRAEDPAWLQGLAAATSMTPGGAGVNRPFVEWLRGQAGIQAPLSPEAAAFAATQQQPGQEGAVTSQGLPGAPAGPGGTVVAAGGVQNTFTFPGMSVTVNGDLSEDQKQRLGEEVGTLVVTAIKEAATAARP